MQAKEESARTAPESPRSGTEDESLNYLARPKSKGRWETAARASTFGLFSRKRSHVSPRRFPSACRTESLGHGRRNQRQGSPKRSGKLDRSVHRGASRRAGAQNVSLWRKRDDFAQLSERSTLLWPCHRESRSPCNPNDCPVSRF